jgi:Protein of unknown function (DUF2971)
MERRLTLLCFSADWSNPLIWVHYSDKHKGLCLGFEIPSEVAKAKTRSVTYIPAALTFPKDILNLDKEKQQALAEEITFTKFRDWQYEGEIRTWLDKGRRLFRLLRRASTGRSNHRGRIKTRDQGNHGCARFAGRSGEGDEGTTRA